MIKNTNARCAGTTRTPERSFIKIGRFLEYFQMLKSVISVYATVGSEYLSDFCQFRSGTLSELQQCQLPVLTLKIISIQFPCRNNALFSGSCTSRYGLLRLCVSTPMFPLRPCPGGARSIGIGKEGPIGWEAEPSVIFWFSKFQIFYMFYSKS